MIKQEEIALFIEAGQKVGAEHLQLCSSGNISWRIQNGLALVSGTGSWLGQMKEENVAICRIADGQHLEGARPSMESTFHLNILREREDVNVVLHFQSEYATAIACMKEKPQNFNVTAEIPCHLGSEIPIIPYFRPGSPELAQAVTQALKEHDAALLSKHGQVVCGKDFNDALQKALFFEMACGIIMHAGKGNYEVLSPEEIEDLQHYILKKS